MNTREQFGEYLLLKKLTEDPLGETFRAGLLGSKGMERVALLRIFNGQGLDGNRLWQSVEGRSGVQKALNSPNIGEGIEMGQLEGIPFVAYDYVSGKNMANLLEQAAKKRNFLPAEHALLITERIALALASAAETKHQNERIQHGFLIPHLVIISNEGETRLLGFEVGHGLRTFAANPVIRQHFGRYLAPEALAGAAPDRVDDIYSLGVILYELLTGRPLPPPGPDGFNAIIDQGIVATEGTPIPAELGTLLKQSLVPRDNRIKDVVTWHKTLNKWMFDGQYNPTTFNLAFFMHNLFRQEIERESQEIEVEKTLPLPVVKREEAAPVAAAAVVAAPAAAAIPGEGTRPGTSPGVGEATENFIPEYAREEKKSKTGLILGALAALLLLAVGGWYAFGGKGTDTTTQQAAQRAPAPPPPEPQYTGPTEDELRNKIQELVSQESEALQAQHQDELDSLRGQLVEAQKDAEDRKKREEERKQLELETAAAEEEARLAQIKADEDAAALAKAEEDARLKQEAEEAAKKAEEAKAAAAPPEQAKPAPPKKPQVRRGDLVEPGEGVIMPTAARQTQPRYPEMARRFNKKEATVLVKVLIDENGKVVKAELAGKPQKFGFDGEALNAARRWVYKPATKNGVPVKIWHTVAIRFKDR